VNRSQASVASFHWLITHNNRDDPMIQRGMEALSLIRAAQSLVDELIASSPLSYAKGDIPNMLPADQKELTC
jgi:hypothetical protein